MDDRTGVMFSAALMMIAATKGTDGDVAVAKLGSSDGFEALAVKYFAEANEMVAVIKAMASVVKEG